MDKLKLELARLDFVKNKKEKGLKDFKEFIREFYPKDKEWFVNLCLSTTIKDDETKVITDREIKKQFYEKYFSKNSGKISARAELLGDWLE